VLGDGKCTSFWSDVWFQDEPLADRFPALMSHCTLKQASVWEIKTTGILPTLVPRLSTPAEHELQLVLQIIDQIKLTAVRDKRSSPFFRPDNSLDSGALYKMIKARGQEDNPRANFIWKSLAPPRVQLFLWLLMQRRIQCRLVLLRKDIVDSGICEICNAADESPEHVIHGCCLGRGVWTSLNLLSIISVDMNDLHSVQAHSSTQSQSWRPLLLWYAGRFERRGMQGYSGMKRKRCFMCCRSAYLLPLCGTQIPNKEKINHRSMVLHSGNG